METKKADFAPVAQEIGKSRRMSGLAVGLGVAGATGVGAAAGVVLNNMLGKKHYDLDDDDDEIEENDHPTEDTKEKTHDNTRHNDDSHNYPQEPQHVQEQEVVETPDVNGGHEPVDTPVEPEPLGWLADEGPDGEDVYYLIIGDPKTGTPMIAVAESEPGSGIYDVVYDLTQDPVTVEPLETPFTREQLEDVMPNPGRDAEPELEPEPDPNGGEGEDDDDNDKDDDDKDDDDTDGEEVIDDDEIIIDEDEVVIDDEVVIVDEDGEIIGEENVIVDEEVYGAPVEGLDPDIEEPYIDENLYPEDDMLDEPMDDMIM